VPVAGRLGIELLSGAAAAFRLLDLLIPGENIFYFSVRRGREEVKKEGFRVFFVTSNHKKVTVLKLCSEGEESRRDHVLKVLKKIFKKINFLKKLNYF